MPEETRGTPVAMIARAVRRERDRAGLSLSELAKRAGIAKSSLSQLEAGAGNPSVETIWALGVALDVPFSRLVEEPPRQPVRILRAGEGPAMHSEESSYTATLLASSPPHARHDVYRIRAEPGEPRVSQPHPAGTTEHVVLGRGRALVGPVDEPVELRPGDYLSYPGDAPHIFRALAKNTAAVIVMEHL
jgi:transcriptional regulator with XRE-family HTH domain